MVGLLSGRSPPEQRIILQSGTSRSGFRKHRRTTWIADRRVRRGVQVPFVVVRRMGRSSRRRQVTNDSRTAGFCAESSQ